MAAPSGAEEPPRPLVDVHCPWRDLSGAADLELRDFPSFLLLRLATAIQRSVMPQYTRGTGLSLPEWRLLPLLARSSSVQLSALTALSTLDKALVSRAVRLLDDKRLVTVEPDPGHGRRLVIAITPAGRALVDRVLPEARRHQAALLALLDADERVALYGAIHKLIAAMEGDGPADGSVAPG